MDANNDDINFGKKKVLNIQKNTQNNIKFKFSLN